jgi:hypothetical protein
MVDGANELTGVSRGETMTVMGSLSNSVSGVAINGQSASIGGNAGFNAAGSFGTSGMHGDVSSVQDIGIGFSWGATVGFTAGF